MIAAWHRRNRSGASRGFTLIELSIVMVVAGQLVVAGLGAYRQYAIRAKLDTNSERLKTVQQALTNYVKINKHLPCVADPALPAIDPNYGKATDCTTGVTGDVNRVNVPATGGLKFRMGAVPVRDLNLTNQYLANTDGYLYAYAVTETLTNTAGFAAGVGTIPVEDGNNHSLVTPANAAMYVLIDYGHNGFGAHTLEGKQPIPCTGPPSFEKQNCDNNPVPLISAPYSTAAGLNHFDDTVIFHTFIDQLDPPSCAPDEALTYTGTPPAYGCVKRDTPPTCAPPNVLTSTDGVTFTCTPSTSPPPTCGANQVLSYNGVGYSCVSQDAPPPTCTANYVLTGSGGVFTCTLRDAPPTCLAGQVLTSTAGVFSCVSNATTLPICPAGTVLTSTDGTSYTCVSMTSPPPACAANYVLTSDGTSFSCVPMPAALPVCSGTDVLTWNGTSFACVVQAGAAKNAIKGICKNIPGGGVEAWAPACDPNIGDPLCLPSPNGSVCSCQAGYTPIEYGNAPAKNAKTFACMQTGAIPPPVLPAAVECPSGMFMTGMVIWPGCPAATFLTQSGSSVYCGATLINSPAAPAAGTSVPVCVAQAATLVTDLNGLSDVLTDYPNNTILINGTTNTSQVGKWETAVGTNALWNIAATGDGNSAVGWEALSSNTTGANNVAFGRLALGSNTIGAWNTAVGDLALFNNLEGNNNTAVGHAALMNNTTIAGPISGNGNTAVGDNAGQTMTTGSNTTYIGYQADTSFDGGLQNSTGIGAQARPTLSNEVRFGNDPTTLGTSGNSVVTLIGGQVAWTAVSDRRLKKDILDSDLGLDFIERLRPVSYRLKAGNGRLDYGFIAQEVETALDGRITNMVVQANDKDKTYNLRASDLLAPLVKAVQQQKDLIEKQQAEIDQRQKRLDDLQKALDRLSPPRQGDRQ